MRIDYYLGDDPPRTWLIESGILRQTPPEPLVMFWVENMGTRDESLSDAYIAVPGAEDLHPFSGGNPPMPSSLRPGFPRVFGQSLQGVSRELENRGCTGTAHIELVIRLGRGTVHTKRIEIRDVEAKAKG